MGKQKIVARRMNMDAWCLNDLNTGNGFVITEPAVMSMDENKQKMLFGARSELYGTTYEDEQSFLERYRCQCGETKGYMFSGETCPYCNTKVEARDINIQFTGWIILKDRSVIINPLYYNIFSSIFGKTGGRNIFQEIITEKMRVDRDGHRFELTEEDYDDDHVPSSPFEGIGIDKFRQRFDEILNYFIAKIEKKKGKGAKQLKKILLNEKQNVFMSCIPVYSTFLRPQSLTADSYYFTGIDKQINPIFSLSQDLIDCPEIDRPMILSRIQQRVNALWEMNFQILNGKDGWIRDQIMGGGLNYTARNVIIPDVTLRDNQVDLSYYTFRELFKLKIIYYIKTTENCTLSQAKRIWKLAATPTPKMLRLMNHIVKKEELCVLINRNPTLNYYSMLLMNIRKVKADPDDYTLSIPLGVLAGLNADFDGDIMNIVACQTDEIKKMFRKYEPTRHMIISRDTGYLNEYFSISKSEKINLFAFNEL